MLFAQEAVETVVQSSTSQLLDSQLWGIAVRDIAALLFIKFALLATLTKTGRWSWAVLKWACKGEPAPAAAEVEPTPVSPAAEQALEALSCVRPTYDPKTHRLLCEGLLVTFASEAGGADVSCMLAAPIPNPLEKGVYGGKDISSLVSPTEYNEVRETARALRAEVIERDRQEENLAAAQSIFEARQASLRPMANHYGAPTLQSPDGKNEPQPGSIPPVSRSRNVPTIGRYPPKKAL